MLSTLAAAAPAGPGSGTSGAVGAGSTWAYGALAQASASGAAPSGSSGSFAYQAKATLGFAVVVNETHPSANVYVLNISRVMGSIVTVTFCRPNCVNPISSAAIAHRAWESVNSSSTLLTNGSVLEGTTTVPALALERSTLTLSAGLLESASWFLGAQLQRAHNLTAQLNASDNLSLAPPLGLFPLNATPGENWTSASVFTQTGGFGWSFTNRVYGAVVRMPQNFSLHGGGVFLPTGTVTLLGRDTAAPVVLGGSSFQAVELNVAGPFALREGWILLPTFADVFGSTNQSWLANQSSFANATQTNFDVGAHLLGSGHLAIGGSRELWFARSSNPAVSAITSVIGPAVASPSTAPSSNTTYVQGAPESPAQATADQNCLATGVGCPSGTGPLRGLFGLVVVVGAVAVVACLAAVLVVGQRRRLPPPVFPNAALYPPGTQRGGTPPTAAAPAASPKPEPVPSEEEDPLSHLW